MVALIVPEDVLDKVPISVGFVKLPDESESWAVNTLLEFNDGVP